MPTTSIYAPQTTERLYVEHCVNCGIVFGMPTAFQETRKLDKSSFYCPNGHGQSYTRTTEQDLRRQIEQARNDTAYWRERYAEEQRSLRATKGHLTRTKKRLAAGVCPYCHRNFVALGKHIRGQHPDECEGGS